MPLLPDSLVPANDAVRVRSLHNYQILNTTPEPVFDEYVALAAQLFNLPISLISLVDEQEVFFKANTGLPGVERVGRAESLCSAAVLQDQVLSFPDLQQEHCQLINPYVAQSAGLRFYAGAALRVSEGVNIGAMCVIGREPRFITTAEEELLMTLARLVSCTIELRHAYLSRNQAEAWQQAQAELQELLQDNSALARYLSNRGGAAPAQTPDITAVEQRMAALQRVLDQRMAALASEVPAGRE